jgi:hypothetical protein
MTEQQCTRLVRTWIRRLGLDSWPNIEIEYHDNPRVQRKPTDADVNWLKGYRVATLRIRRGMLTDQPRVYIVRTVVHELRHLHYAKASDAIARYVGDGSIVYKAWGDVEEDLCDQDAAAFMRAWGESEGGRDSGD